MKEGRVPTLVRRRLTAAGIRFRGRNEGGSGSDPRYASSFGSCRRAFRRNEGGSGSDPRFVYELRYSTGEIRRNEGGSGSDPRFRRRRELRRRRLAAMKEGRVPTLVPGFRSSVNKPQSVPQ